MVLSAAVMAIEKFPVIGRRITMPLGVLITIWGVAVLASSFMGVDAVHGHVYP